MTPTVEPAGVSEPPFPKYPGETLQSMAEIGEAFMDAMPEGYSWCQSPAEVIADLQNERDEARQQLAELQAENAHLHKSLDVASDCALAKNQRLLSLEQQLAEMREECDDKQREIDRLCAMAAQVEDLRRFREQHSLAPASQPSFETDPKVCTECGKRFSCCEHGDKSCRFHHPPDCAQPERQGTYADTRGTFADTTSVYTSPPQDDIVAGLRNLRREISYAWTNCEDDLALLDRAIAALSEKGWHSSHKMDSHCIACGMSTEDERIKQACDP